MDYTVMLNPHEHMLIIDLETRSRCNLLERGAFNYAEDLSTEVLCIGYSLLIDAKTGERLEGCVDTFDALPAEVLDYITDEHAGLIAAWNAQFDMNVWNATAPAAFRVINRRWYCLAAAARVNALPSSLNDAGKFVFKRYVKDIRGPQLIKLLSIPREDGTFNEDALLRREMREYCLQDARASLSIATRLRPLSNIEHRDWLDGENINRRGVRVDTALAELAQNYAKAEQAALAERLDELTDGAVTKATQTARLKKYMLPLLPEPALALITVKGKTTLDKNARARLLAGVDTLGLSQRVLAILEIMDSATASSVAKFKRMALLADDLERVRGAFVFAGASQTLRYASRGLQMHNLKRECFSASDAEYLISRMAVGLSIEPVMYTLGKLLRPAIIPADGCVFVVGDWSSVEARALPWLADDQRARARLDLFRTNADIYSVTAKEIGLRDRQMGKITELSMGFGGGVGALSAMAANYGMHIPEAAKKNIVNRWRAANPWAPDFWNLLEKQARRAVGSPHNIFTAGLVNFQFIPALLEGTLVVSLPGGGTIQYPAARLEQETNDYGTRTVVTCKKASIKPAAKQPEWPRITLWRGLLAENVTQALCALLLRDGLYRCSVDGLSVVAHTHDEIILEVPVAKAPHAEAQLRKIMELGPSWARGLPLSAVPKTMTRYGK